MKRPTEPQARTLRFGAELGWICLTDYAPATRRAVLRRGWFKRNRTLKHGEFADITAAGREAAERVAVK